MPDARTGPAILHAVDARSSLEAMLEARSVAVVGASAREGSFGEQMMRELLKGEYTGRIMPVNPRYREIHGHPCHPTVADLPEPPDLVMLGLPNAKLEDGVRACADVGARSAVIFASGYEPARDGTPPLTERITTMARRAGMAICGGNCMGFFNLTRGLRVTGFNHPDRLEPGGITFVSHSGSAFSAMLHNDRQLRFNLVVSSGQEFVTTAADYLSYALDQPSTRVAALFIETVRDPDRFRQALATAAELDVPVVVLKVGRAEQAKELIVAHSGALAGEDGAYEALFDAYGVLRVQTLDEMADTVELLAAGRRAGPGGLAAIHDSGGERALLIDAAASSGVALARIGEETTGRLAAVLEEGLPPVNPLDAWGTGNKAEDIFIECMHALLDDPDTAALAFCVDLTPELVEEAGYTRVANEVFARTGKPVAVLSNLASAIDRRDAAFVRKAGIPVLEGTMTGLAAFRHLLAYRDFRAARPGPGESRTEVGDRSVGEQIARKHGIDPSHVAPWKARLAASNGPLPEADSLAMLADFGIPVTGNARASTVEAAVEAAERFGYPVVLKTAAPGVTHKSDVGGVVLGVDGPDAVARAYRDIAERLGPEVTVARTAPAGVELALGIVRDEQFGPLVMVAAGGVLIEVLRDRRMALPPVDRERARRMLDLLAIGPLLDGVRGKAPVDRDMVADAIERVGVIAVAFADDIQALDVNPLIAGPDGCVAVDALIVPKK